MSTSDAIVTGAEIQAPPQRTGPEPPPITVGEAWPQPRPKPADAAELGYLHAGRGEPVA